MYHRNSFRSSALAADTSSIRYAMKARILAFAFLCTLLFIAVTASAQPSTAHDREPIVPAFSKAPQAFDSTVLNSIGWLFNDDKYYYERAPIWLPLVKITLSNAALWAVDRYVFNYDFSHISLESWKRNLQEGWTWNDSDRFGNDFFFHPYTGGGYFMDARSLGYDFWESIPFALFGAVEWKYFGENDQPTYPDLINTTINGTFMGEVAYRLTSDVIDDRAKGGERVWREAFAALLSPSRFFSRLITGKLWKIADRPVLEREPTDVSLSVGPHLVNNGTSFGTGPVKLSLNGIVEYGNPFEAREHKPFDHFKLWGEFTNAYERKYLGGVTGYGLLAGTNNGDGEGIQTMFGIFQHFDYFDNLTFEFGAVPIGLGLLTKIPLTSSHNIYENVNASFIPFGANNAGYFPVDTAQSRDYSYGDGYEIMDETGLNVFNNTLNLSLVGYYIYFNSYYGQVVTNNILLLKPRIVLNLFDNVGIGLEHQIYQSHRTSPVLAPATLNRTEQRFFVQWRWDDFPKQ